MYEITLSLPNYDVSCLNPPLTIYVQQKYNITMPTIFYSNTYLTNIYSSVNRSINPWQKPQKPLITLHKRIHCPGLAITFNFWMMWESSPRLWDALVVPICLNNDAISAVCLSNHEKERVPVGPGEKHLSHINSFKHFIKVIELFSALPTPLIGLICNLIIQSTATATMYYNK